MLDRCAGRPGDRPGGRPRHWGTGPKGLGGWTAPSRSTGPAGGTGPLGGARSDGGARERLHEVQPSNAAHLLTAPSSSLKEQLAAVAARLEVLDGDAHSAGGLLEGEEGSWIKRASHGSARGRAGLGRLARHGPTIGTREGRSQPSPVQPAAHTLSRGEKDLEPNALFMPTPEF